MSRLLLLATVCGFVAFSLNYGFAQNSSAEIAARPEQLKFPPLKYEPPDPRDHRVELKSGPVAYVVPSRELPLVQIEILVRTGDYLGEPGKEGLPAMTGYLIGKGGTKNRTAE